MTDSAVVTALLEYWFADCGESLRAMQARTPFWFGPDAGRDRTIEATFGEASRRALAGELDSLAQSPRGRLALVLLLDQVPRNVHRGSAAAYAGDAAAMDWAATGIDHGVDQRLAPWERMFFYMPYQHAESLASQERSVALYDALAAAVDSGLRPAFDATAAFARQHRDIVARFGRFPHRNECLGRTPTPDELEFLAAGGATFGQ